MPGEAFTETQQNPYARVMDSQYASCGLRAQPPVNISSHFEILVGIKINSQFVVSVVIMLILCSINAITLCLSNPFS